MSILVRVEGASKDLRIMYPEPEEIQLNFCTLIDLEFTSFSNKEEVIVQFQLNDVVALKIQTQEEAIHASMLGISRRTNGLGILHEQLCGDREISISCLDGQKPQLETITEEDDPASPNKRKPGKKTNQMHKNRVTLKISPGKTKSPKRISLQHKKSTLRWSQSMIQTPKSPLKGDYVDALLAQLIQQNNRKSKSRKRRPSTSYPLRPKIDSEGMIDRQWLEEEMINEDL